MRNTPQHTTAAAGTLPRPATVVGSQIRWIYAGGVLGMHALALLALLPSLFHWASLAVAVAGIYVFGTLGINLCYHRLLTHRGYQCPIWLEHGLAILGICSFQDTPARWVAVHRLHHQHSDEQPDPHSPLVTFFWGHMEWLLIENSQLKGMALYERYAKDLLGDRFYRRLECGMNWLWIILAQWVVFLAVGAAVGLVATGRVAGAWNAGLSLLVWGVFVRTVVVWHITWSVNSVTHRWGYRNYETGEGSRNNLLIGLLSNGEGWHNNHHAEPRAASHGHRWWEFDLTFRTLRLLESVGLAWDLVLPKSWDAAPVASRISRGPAASAYRPIGLGLRAAEGRVDADPARE